jgi:hypothetical protein
VNLAVVVHLVETAGMVAEAVALAATAEDSNFF